MRKIWRIWRTSDRWLCQMNEDGTVQFAENLTVEELQWALATLLQQRERERLGVLYKCPQCRCHEGCCCCTEVECGCNVNGVRIDEDENF